MFSLSQIRSLKTAVGSSALALLFAGATAPAQVTYNAQIPFNLGTFSPALVTPEGVAVAPDGTVYLANVDSATSGRVIRITPTGTVGGTSGSTASLSTSSVVTLAPAVGGTTVTLVNPNAVAVDSAGDLYIADIKGHQVLELTNPETSSVATAIPYPGTENPSALAVDSSNNLYIADATQNKIYEAVGGVATALTLTQANLQPVGLAVDATGNVYFADAHNNELYKYTASSKSSAVYLASPSTGAFHFSSATAGPIGMGFDPAGYLYVLDSSAGRLWQITSATPSTNFRVPYASIAAPGSLTVSSVGNLYMSDNTNKAVDELFYNNNPVNFGSIPAGTASAKVNVNFQFNTTETNPTFYQSVQGDSTGEFVTTSTACSGNNGTTCTVQFEAKYLVANPGLRNGIFGITKSNVIWAVPSIGISLTSKLALYPGVQTTLSQTAQTLYEPQALAVTGNGGTLFVADEGGVFSPAPPSYTHGAVWAYTGGAGTPTQVGGFTTPMGLALDPSGDLFVADYSGTVTELSPPWTGFGKTLTFPAGIKLYHPMALAFDPSGNLYIGDMGSAGSGATDATPGFIVKVPADGGPAVQLNLTVGGVAVAYPDGLACDSYGNLYVADGGGGNDPSQIVVVPAGTTTATAISLGSPSGTPLNQPSAIAIDAANDLYVLDGFNQRVLVAPITYSGTTPSVNPSNVGLLGQGVSGITAALITPTSMVLWPGGNQITIADIGYQPQAGTASPVQVVTLNSQNASVDASGGSVNLMGVDVGNQNISFLAPTSGGANPSEFNLTNCGSSGTSLVPGVLSACTTTLNYTGVGQTTEQSATFTLNGNPAVGTSTLGNVINVIASPQEPVGVLSGAGYQTSVFSQASVTNTGGLPLLITAITTGPNNLGSLTITGGTCGSNPTVLPQTTCTITYTINTTTCEFLGFLPYPCADSFINVTDNTLNVPGTVQSIEIQYAAGIPLATPVGGPGLGSKFGLSGLGSGSHSTGVGLPHGALNGQATGSGGNPNGGGVPDNRLPQSNSVVQPGGTVQTINAAQPTAGVESFSVMQPGATDSNDSVSSDDSSDSGNTAQTNDTTGKDHSKKKDKTENPDNNF